MYIREQFTATWKVAKDKAQNFLKGRSQQKVFTSQGGERIEPENITQKVEVKDSPEHFDETKQ